MKFHPKLESFITLEDGYVKCPTCDSLMYPKHNVFANCDWFECLCEQQTKIIRYINGIYDDVEITLFINNEYYEVNLDYAANVLFINSFPMKSPIQFPMPLLNSFKPDYLINKIKTYLTFS